MNNLEKLLILWTIRLTSRTVKIPSVETAGIFYDTQKDILGLKIVQIADVKKNNDYAMWLKIIEKAECYRFHEVLSYYYKHDNSISSGSKIKLIKHHYILYRKAMELGKLKSVLYTIKNLFFGVLKKIKYIVNSIGILYNFQEDCIIISYSRL